MYVKAKFRPILLRGIYLSSCYFCFLSPVHSAYHFLYPDDCGTHNNSHPLPSPMNSKSSIYQRLHIYVVFRLLAVCPISSVCAGKRLNQPSKEIIDRKTTLYVRKIQYQTQKKKKENKKTRKRVGKTPGRRIAGLRVMSKIDFSKNQFLSTLETRETGKTARMNVHSGVSSIALVLFLGSLFLFDALRSVLVEFLVLLHDLALAALTLSTTSGTVGVTVSIFSFLYASQFVIFDK